MVEEFLIELEISFSVFLMNSLVSTIMISCCMSYLYLSKAGVLTKKTSFRGCLLSKIPSGLIIDPDSTFRQSYLGNIMSTNRNFKGWDMCMTVLKKDLQCTIGKNIKDARMACGYTKEVLAEKAEISVEHITQVERGDKMMSIPSLVRMAEALHVSVDALIYEHSTNDARQSIAQLLVTVSEDDSRRLFALLQYVNDHFLQ